MSEQVIVRQNSQYETEFQIPDPEDPESGEWLSIAHLHALTPYGMLLASIGGCTAVLLNSYAQNHGLELEEVELHLEYKRDFDEDCENCERIERYEERIVQKLRLAGQLTAKERDKLFAISHQCPIEKMVQQGIEIDTELVEA